MKETKPLVSVIMPVYNAEKYLAEAVESILSQTYKNFEFIITDDASTDESWKILKKYAAQDKRIKLFRNSRNLGISATVREIINKSRGIFIARMDADDIAMPQRLETQINYLQRHKKTVAIGGQCIIIDKDGNNIGVKKFPTKFKDVYNYIFQFVPVQQPTLMIAGKRLPIDFEYYVDGMNTAEEVELIFKLFSHGKVENLPETVLKYRLHESNTSLINIKNTFMLTLYTRIKSIFKYGYRPSVKVVFISLIETFVVLLLPQKVSLKIYKQIRTGITTQNTLSSIFSKISYLKFEKEVQK
ncbi:MAG: glycosyltransferase [Patescibacteria group bacterium]|nr:glycosyltransferase [Patescibacteria group bacterium]